MKYSIDESSLTAIADKIRDLSGITEHLRVSEMVGKIGELYDAGITFGKEVGQEIEQAITTGILDGTITEYCNDKVETIKQYCFNACSKLKTVDLPKVTRVKGYGFRGCTVLENVNIPKIKEIGDYNLAVFFQCKALKKVDFHECEKIHALCFNQCSALETVIFRSPTICIMNGGGAFASRAESFAIYVPDNLVEEYKVATNWVQYADEIKPLSELPEGVET